MGLIIIGGFFLLLQPLLVHVLVSYQCGSDALTNGDGPMVETECGPVEGIKNAAGINSFKGIPYSVAPTNRRRWQPPTPLSKEEGTCWNGTYKALTYSQLCPQLLPTNQSFGGSEDCLYLNIFTPSLSSTANLPVMVWIHGGYLLFGTGTWPKYGPDETTTAKYKYVVFVTFNYRLNVFGFLALDILSTASQSQTSGNYGFMDQILVLKWVQNNIKNFGGNPNKVTIFGQSSGGTSVYALMLSPLANGLFHRAWAMSGSPAIKKTLKDVSVDNLKILQATGCTTTNCLYQLSAEKLVNAAATLWNYVEEQGGLPTKGKEDPSLIIADGTVIPDLSFKVNDVPIVIGTTAQEIDEGPTPDNIDKWTLADYKKYVTDKLTPFGQQLVERALLFYPPYEGNSPEYLYTSLVSDWRVSCPNDKLSDIIAKNLPTKPLYRYILVQWPSVPTYAFTGMHNFKAKYSFHNFDNMAFEGFIPDFIPNPTIKDIGLEMTITENMLHFVKHGIPSNISWTPWPSQALMKEDLYVVKGRFLAVKCQLWDPLFDYAWTN